MFGFGNKKTATEGRLKILVLTGNSPRHYYFANRLAETYHLVGVVSEATKPHLLSEIATQHPLVRLYYTNILEKEVLYFGKHRQFATELHQLRTIGYGQIHTNTVQSFITERNPDYIITFHASLLDAALVTPYKERVLHLHNGLINYYNGSNATLWPIIDGRMECVGMTVHLIESDNDSGRVLGQIRPALSATDTIADIDLKSVVAGTTLMEQCIHQFHQRRLTLREVSATPQTHVPEDLTPDKILKAKQLFEQGVMQTYISQQKHLQQTAPIEEVR